MHKAGQSDIQGAAGVEQILYYFYLVLIVIHDIGDHFFPRVEKGHGWPRSCYIYQMCVFHVDFTFES